MLEPFLAFSKRLGNAHFFDAAGWKGAGFLAIA